MNKLDGKTAFISGSTSGIGEACARRFAEAAAKVISQVGTSKQEIEL